MRSKPVATARPERVSRGSSAVIEALNLVLTSKIFIRELSDYPRRKVEAACNLFMRSRSNELRNRMILLAIVQQTCALLRV